MDTYGECGLWIRGCIAAVDSSPMAAALICAIFTIPSWLLQIINCSHERAPNCFQQSGEELSLNFLPLCDACYLRLCDFLLSQLLMRLRKWNQRNFGQSNTGDGETISTFTKLRQSHFVKVFADSFELEAIVSWNLQSFQRLCEKNASKANLKAIGLIISRLRRLPPSDCFHSRNLIWSGNISLKSFANKINLVSNCMSSQPASENNASSITWVFHQNFRVLSDSHETTRS